MGLWVFLNALICTGLILFFTPLIAWTTNISTALFFLFYLITHFALLFFLIVAFPALIIKKIKALKSSWFFYLFIAGALSLLVVFIDTRVFALYRFHINAMVINLLTGGAATEIISFSLWMWISSILIVVFILSFQFFLTKIIFSQKFYSGTKIWIGLFVALLGTQLFYAYREAISDTVITSQLSYVPWAQPLTMKTVFLKAGLIKKVASSPPNLNLKGSSALLYPLSPMKCVADKKYNILIIMIDSIRRDIFTKEIMPHTVKFSKSAIVFNRHWSTGNSTRFGVFGFFYGLPSTYWFDMLRAQRGAVLFDVLDEQGYDFHLDAAAPLNSPEFDRTVFSRVRSHLQWGKDKNNKEKEVDTVVIEHLLSYIDKWDGKKPFFAFSFLNAPHYHYSLPKKEKPHFQPALKSITSYLSLNNDYDPTRMFNRYKSSVYYDDRLLGRVYKKLKSKGLMKNTIVIVSGDHAEEFNDLKQNYWLHNSNFSTYQIEVPMIIHWPKKKSRLRNILSSHEDVAPTLLTEALGCVNDISDYSSGFNLFSKDKVFVNRKLLLSNWTSKAIYTGKNYYIFPPVGSMQILDKNYVKLKSAVPDYGIINKVLLKARAYRK